MQQHLKDNLFHGVHKHIRDSIWYLYSNARTTYSQLMIAAYKVESKNEAQDKVRARSAVITEPAEGTTELGNQIAKLMAALTIAGPGNSPGSAPNSPNHRGHERGQIDRNTPGHPNSHNGQTGLGQTTSAHSVSASHGTGTTSQSQGNTQGSKDSHGSTSNRKDNSSLQCFRCQGWGHMAQECATLARALNQSRGKQGNAAQPPNQHQLQQPTVGPKHSFPDPKPKLTILQVAQKKGWPEVIPVPFLNPDSIPHLVGCSNKAPVIVDGQDMTALIDLSAQVSSVSSQFCEGIALQIQPLVQLLELEGMGSAAIPYLAFIEVNLQIPGITNYNEDVLLLVIPTMTCSKMVPVIVGSKIIDRALGLMTKGDLAKATTIWRQAHFGAVMSGSLQLTHKSSDKTGMEEEVGHSSQSGDPVEVRKFCLNDFRGPVCTTWKVTIPPFSTVSVHANFSVKGHCMWVHVLMELMSGLRLPAMVVLTVTYGELHLGSSRVPIFLDNLSTHTMEIPAKAVVGQVACQPSPTGSPPNQDFWIVKPQEGWILETLDLQGLQEWPESEQKQARELLLKWDHLFVCSDLDLGKTALIKQNKGDRLDTLQRMLPMYTSPHEQQCEGPYPRYARYWFYPKVTQSMG